MKMTIVLDTDDTKGLDDAYKIALMLHKRHVRPPYGGQITGKKAAFGKIALIKFIRAFARECEAQVASAKINGEDPELSALRNTKRFVDAHWDGLDEA
tara:strand:- start:3590 stop:3883 length:294 start_codon:yes stop_codon:yes gene_type:complete